VLLALHFEDVAVEVVPVAEPYQRQIGLDHIEAAHLHGLLEAEELKKKGGFRLDHVAAGLVRRRAHRHPAEADLVAIEDDAGPVFLPAQSGQLRLRCCRWSPGVPEVAADAARQQHHQRQEHGDGSPAGALRPRQGLPDHGWDSCVPAADMQPRATPSTPDPGRRPAARVRYNGISTGDGLRMARTTSGCCLGPIC
jgi:hypothetical protein